MRIFPFILVVLFFILAGSVSSPAQNAASVEPLLLYKAQQDKNCRHWVDSVMDKLSFKEKVGQLFIYTIAPVNTKRNLELLREAIDTYKVGGLLFSGGKMQNQVELTNRAQRQAKVPVMITFDGEWGVAMRLRGTPVFPRNMVLGCIRDNRLIYEYGREVARQCRQIGVQVNFAPVADVNINPKNPVINTRSFGEDPIQVADKVIAYASGLEGGGVLSVCKHFPGHGDTDVDSHKALPILPFTRERLDSVELYPFKEAIRAGVGGMMVGHLQVPVIEPIGGLPSSLSRNVVYDLLTKIGGNKFDYGMNAGYQRPFASGINPAGALLLDKDEIVSHQFNGNGSFEAKFLKYFKITANVGLQYLGSAENELTNPYYGDSAGKGQIAKYQTNYLNFTANQILSWGQSFDKHNFDAFVAHESTSSKTSVAYGSKSKIVRPDNTEWSNGVIMDYLESYTYGYSIESYFGQLRYDYDNKYFLHGTVRADGSSRFAKGNKWGIFGSVGAAWAITNEDFMKDVKWLKNLKYKLSWGVLGNQDFITSPVVAGYYPYEDLYTIDNLNDEFTFSFKFKGNPDLTWERSTTINTGIEFNIADVLEGEVEYFHKKTTDMLFMKQVAPSLGYASYPVNDGALVNKGVEFSLTAHLLNKKDYKFDFRLNGGYYKNEMTQMPIDETTGTEKPIEISTYYGWAKGHSLYDFYIREYAGVDPETGFALYNQYYNVKANGERELITDMETYKSKNTINKLEVEQTSDWDKATKKFVDKSGIPALQGGFGFDLYAKGITLNATFSYGIGGYGYDYNYAAIMHSGTSGSYNWHKDIEGRWQKPGDITNIPSLSNDYGGGADGTNYANASSTRFLTSRSFLNLANVRIGYSLPKSIVAKLHLSDLNFFISGDNLLYWSARKGYVSMASSGNSDNVNDDNKNDSGESGRSQYAPLSTIMGGIKIQF